MTDTTADIATDPVVTDGVTADAGIGGPGGHDPSATNGEDGANRTQSSGRGPAVPDVDDQPVGGRVRVTWRHALAAGLVCFGVWLVLDAPTLMHSAQDALTCANACPDAG